MPHVCSRVHTCRLEPFSAEIAYPSTERCSSGTRIEGKNEGTIPWSSLKIEMSVGEASNAVWALDGCLLWKTEYLVLGACTSGTLRSQQKSANDPKIARKLSKVLGNVRVPELQSSLECGGTTADRVSVLRLLIPNTAMVGWDRSPKSRETCVGGVARLPLPLRSVPYGTW